MTNATIIGEEIDPERVALARKRLEAFAARHDIDLERYGAFERQDDAGWVSLAMNEMYGRAENDAFISRQDYSNALAIFRRAIGHSQATHLHISNGQAYAAW